MNSNLFILIQLLIFLTQIKFRSFEICSKTSNAIKTSTSLNYIQMGRNHFPDNDITDR